MEQHVNPVMLEHISACNVRYRDILGHKINAYYQTQQSAARLQRESTTLTEELHQKRESLSALKKQYSKEGVTLNRIQRKHLREASDIRKDISRADQRVQRRLRRVSTFIPSHQVHWLDTTQERRETQTVCHRSTAIWNC